MILTVNSDYFLKQRQPVDPCNGAVRTKFFIITQASFGFKGLITNCI
jgi:hypothetical protein